MKKCKYCGCENNDNSIFCTECGNRLPDIINESKQQEYSEQNQNNFNQTTNDSFNQTTNDSFNQTTNDNFNGTMNNNVNNTNNYYYNPFDHTDEFSNQDISENKLFAMLPYALSLIGVIISLLAAKDSPYVKFHIKQSIKIIISQFLLAIAGIVTFFTILIPIVCWICVLILEVVSIVMLFSVGQNKAKEAPIVKNFNFFK